jgi:hypothetical protein
MKSALSIAFGAWRSINFASATDGLGRIELNGVNV